MTVTPANVLIPQGSTTPNSNPRVNGINFGSATITASPDASNSAYLSSSMNAQVSASLNFYPQTMVIQAGVMQQGVWLSLLAPDGSAAPAPAGGLTFGLELG